MSMSNPDPARIASVLRDAGFRPSSVEIYTQHLRYWLPRWRAICAHPEHFSDSEKIRCARAIKYGLDDIRSIREARENAPRPGGGLER